MRSPVLPACPARGAPRSFVFEPQQAQVAPPLGRHRRGVQQRALRGSRAPNAFEDTQPRLPRAAACLHVSGGGGCTLNKPWLRAHAHLPCVCARTSPGGKEVAWRPKNITNWYPNPAPCTLHPAPCALHPAPNCAAGSHGYARVSEQITTSASTEECKVHEDPDKYSDAGVQGRS